VISQTLLTSLRAKLPDLELKLNTLGHALSYSQISAGVFRDLNSLSPRACIHAIEIDIQRLSQEHLNEGHAAFVAQQLTQKINVLTGLCRINQKTKPSVSSPLFSIEAIKTRQSWLNTLDADIVALRTERAQLWERLSKPCTTLPTAHEQTLRETLALVERRLENAENLMKRGYP
jgi:hypothetical protein